MKNDILISNLLTVWQGLDLSKAGTTVIRFRAGEVMKALVLSREGETYLLQCGENKFQARSETPLRTGEWVRLLVLGGRDDAVLLKNLSALPPEEAERAAAERTTQLIKKYGVTQEKEIVQVREL